MSKKLIADEEHILQQIADHGYEEGIRRLDRTKMSPSYLRTVIRRLQVAMDQLDEVLAKFEQEQPNG